MSLVRDEYCGFLKQCCRMLKYGNRCSMCIVGQESYAMLEKNATDVCVQLYALCSTICFEEKNSWHIHQILQGCQIFRDLQFWL